MSDPFIGEIRMVGFNFAPINWALCQGQLLAIQQNQALFSLLGTTFGGNGIQNFALPDYQGRSAVGTGNGIGLSPIGWGEKSGAENVSLQTAQMPTHTHPATVSVAIPAVSASTNVASAPGPTTVLGPDSAGGRAATIYSTDAANTSLKPFSPAITVATSGGSQPVALRNPFLGTTFIIAMNGLFPSRQ